MTVDFTAKDLKRVFPTAKFVHLTNLEMGDMATWAEAQTQGTHCTSVLGQDHSYRLAPTHPHFHGVRRKLWVSRCQCKL